MSAHLRGWFDLSVPMLAKLAHPRPEESATSSVGIFVRSSRIDRSRLIGHPVGLPFSRPGKRLRQLAPRKVIGSTAEGCRVSTMRIIAGEFRGRRLDAPPGRGTRPMLDRVREALFNRLQSSVPGARVLDLFAGSGSLGLEALSRGAEMARFIERDSRAARVLRANIDSLKLGDRADVTTSDALRSSSWIEHPDLVFFDAPYPLLGEAESRKRLLVALHELTTATLAKGGCLVFHAPKNAVREHELADAGEVEERVYGTSALWFVERPLEVDG